MKTREPMRICLGCGEKRPKKELLRIVRESETNEFHLDPSGRKNGRGCYICGKSECFENMVKQKKLSRSFETNVDRETYEKLRSEFDGWFNNGGTEIE